MILLIEEIMTANYFIVVLQFGLLKIGKIGLIGIWYTVAATIYITAVASHYTSYSIGLSGLLAQFTMFSTVCGEGIICLFKELVLFVLCMFFFCVGLSENII